MISRIQYKVLKLEFRELSFQNQALRGLQIFFFDEFKERYWGKQKLLNDNNLSVKETHTETLSDCQLTFDWYCNFSWKLIHYTEAAWFSENYF